MTEVNVPLLRKALEWAEAEAARPPGKGEWHQGDWRAKPLSHARMLAWSMSTGVLGLDVRKATCLTATLAQECGTSYCVAGYVAMVLGNHRFDEETWFDADGRHVAEVAATMLGIDPPHRLLAPEPGHLFHSRNDIEDLRRIAESLAGGRL